MSSDIIFCETDGKVIEDRMIADYEEKSGRKLSQSDPLLIFFKSIASEITRQRVVINETGKQNLVRFATGQRLEALGEIKKIERLQGERAFVTVRFTKVAGYKNKVLIPAGVRVTADSVVYFEVRESAVIDELEDYLDISCRAVETGANGNDYAVGSINKLVNPIAFIASISNISVSAGGRDIESDEELRKRIIIAPESYSIAGPELAYKSVVLNSYLGISDAQVVNEGPGVVGIYPLLQGGKLPDEEILEIVEKAVSSKSVRPFNDKVEVKSPEAVNYNIRGTYYLYDDSIVDDKKIDIVINKYITWQKDRLGRDINPDILVAGLIEAGVKRVELEEPLFKVLDSKQVGYCVSASLTFGGLEQE